VGGGIELTNSNAFNSLSFRRNLEPTCKGVTLKRIKPVVGMGDKHDTENERGYMFDVT
jgi:hypothetical protein